MKVDINIKSLVCSIIVILCLISLLIVGTVKDDRTYFAFAYGVMFPHLLGFSKWAWGHIFTKNKGKEIT